MYAGINATLYAVRETFCPIDDRNTIRHVIRQCVKFFRAKPREVDYLMGNLPQSRVAFSTIYQSGCGCGPFYIKE